MINAFGNSEVNYAVATCELYSSIIGSPLSTDQINRISVHNQPKMLYRAMVAQSYYPQTFSNNPLFFAMLTSTMREPIALVLLHKAECAESNLTYGIALLAKHPDVQSDAIFTQMVTLLKSTPNACMWAAIYICFSKLKAPTANPFLSITADSAFLCTLEVALQYHVISKRTQPTCSASREFIETLITLASTEPDFVRHVKNLNSQAVLGEFTNLIDIYSKDRHPIDSPATELASLPVTPLNQTQSIDPSRYGTRPT